MTCLSSTLTRRRTVSTPLAATGGTNAAAGFTASPGRAASLAPSSSKLSMARPPYGYGLLHLAEVAAGGAALGLARAGHLAGRHVQVPLGAGERQPVGV